MTEKKKNYNENMIQVKESALDTYSLHLADLPKAVLDWIDERSYQIIALWDEDARLKYITKSVEATLHFKPDELKNKRWADMIIADEAKSIKQYVTREQPFHVEIKNRYGEKRWFECKIASVQSEHSNYFISIFKDMTSIKEAEELMIRTEKMSISGQLATGVAHEIRNPLTSLKGFLQLLKAGVDAKQAYYRIMLDEINKIESITSELLFISKPMTDQKKEESVQSMIDDVIALLKPQARLRNIKLVTEEKDINNDLVYCDRSQIKQVLINIIKNAIEAVDCYETITIKSRTKENTAEIDVIDRGPGVSEEILHKLSEPFFTTKKSGTGLGLMISEQILKQHNGKLEVLQNKPKGSIFRIVLPNHKT